MTCMTWVLKFCFQQKCTRIIWVMLQKYAPSISDHDWNEYMQSFFYKKLPGCVLRFNSCFRTFESVWEVFFRWGYPTSISRFCRGGRGRFLEVKLGSTPTSFAVVAIFSYISDMVPSLFSNDIQTPDPSPGRYCPSPLLLNNDIINVKFVTYRNIKTWPY